ncbi:MAG: NYN domain-containing protein [Deltaproteobacteria bacterium]|nr:NYN domain-containing protein [Deltaproteobacteria bacterium]MBW2218200.1 NYN domain-containing protein [Deltaproteobacteria bacterium]
MAIHIIIDGYNLIRQSCTLSMLDQQDIQTGRDSLITLLAAYKKIKAHKITVVFDGADAPVFSNQSDSMKGIKIKFSGQGETADAVIKKMASSEREKALVVTSDKDIINFVSSRGAATICSTEFEKKILMADYMMVKGVRGEDEDENGWKPTTKKRGPKRRLSKKERQNRIKTKKL